MKAGWEDAAGAIGLVLAAYGIASAVWYNGIWYSYFAIGGALFFGSINSRLGNRGLFRAFAKNRLRLLALYAIYLLAGIGIELLGRFALHLWHYPKFGLLDEVLHIYLISYPFAFFMIHEIFTALRAKFDYAKAFMLAWIGSAFLNEVPNTRAMEWAYTIPFVKLELLGVNIIVIIGWVILIGVPLIVEKILPLEK